MLEIERKFLMDGFPTGLELISEVDIELDILVLSLNCVFEKRWTKVRE